MAFNRIFIIGALTFVVTGTSLFAGKDFLETSQTDHEGNSNLTESQFSISYGAQGKSEGKTSDSGSFPKVNRYTLKQLVEWAVEHNDWIVSQERREAERRFAAAQARKWPNPELNFIQGRRREATSSGPFYELAVVQPLPLFGKRGLRGDMLRMESEEWRFRAEAARIGVVLDVIRMTYEYVTARNTFEFLQNRQRRFELFRSYLVGRVFASPQRKAERHLVEQRLKHLTSEVVLAHSKLQAAFEDLQVYVDLKRDRYPDIEVPWLSGSKILKKQEEISKALARNFELAIQRVVLKKAEIRHRLASREVWPDFSLELVLEEGRSAELEHNVGGGFSLDFPLWDRNQNEIKSAQENVDAESRLLVFQERRLRTQVLKAIAEYEAIRKVVAQYPRSLIAKLTTQLQDMEREFRKGRVDLLTFLELDEEFADTAERVFAAQRDLVLKAVELLELTGERDPVTHLTSF